MRGCMRKFLLVVIIIYISCASWVMYIMFVERTSSSEANAEKVDGEIIATEYQEGNIFHGTVNIWGKAAIGQYLWLHVFEGKLSQVADYLLYEGSISYKHVRFVYTTGPQLILQTANKSVSNLIVVINGREVSKVRTAKAWLDALVDRQIFSRLRNLAVIMLGNELCDNSWLFYYVNKYSSLIKLTFIVYDDNRINGRTIHQWPLGVATYRKFPLIRKSDVDIHSKRKFTCNFLGTVYANSSRELLAELLSNNSYNCFSKVRHWWVEKETKESMLLYHEILRNSDLTLCPVGINSESYRIYEAMSYGSIPVLEDVMTPGSCGGEDSANAPYALLKKYNAPAIYIKNWRDLPLLLEKEKLLSDHGRMKRRREILEWYESFRYVMREILISATLSHFK